MVFVKTGNWGDQRLICIERIDKLIEINFSVITKVQLILKGLVGILNSSKKRTIRFDLQYYDTSGQLVFVRFLEEAEDTKKIFRN